MFLHRAGSDKTKWQKNQRKQADFPQVHPEGMAQGSKKTLFNGRSGEGMGELRPPKEHADGTLSSLGRLRVEDPSTNLPNT